MPRTRSYDETSVLKGAMQAFRRRGYQGASIRELEEATGLKAGSIYNSFGDKAGLFNASFNYYNQAVLRGRIDRFAPPEAGLAGLRDLFASLMQEPNDESYGCLITNSALEFDTTGDAHRHVCEGLAILSATFADRLHAARTAGRLRAGIDPDVAATKLLALYQGILVLVRARQDKHALLRLVAAEFKELEAHDDI
ncbi:TetR/AcrR family transcriptional regulator [Rhizobium sp. LjRoot254]|uniref:TetR/AcrR family transcriptional regulator n=1 Tax=Rhizobium sp. LjRoot254 TaxID=3342297 RepID=UPI003ED11020